MVGRRYVCKDMGHSRLATLQILKSDSATQGPQISGPMHPYTYTFNYHQGLV